MIDNPEDEAWDELERKLNKQKKIEDDDTQVYQKPWVSLTDKEIKEILDCGRGGLIDIKKVEQMLKERNT